jgi:hypothetical protein
MNKALLPKTLWSSLKITMVLISNYAIYKRKMESVGNMLQLVIKYKSATQRLPSNQNAARYQKNNIFCIAEISVPHNVPYKIQKL